MRTLRGVARSALSRSTVQLVQLFRFLGRRAVGEPTLISMPVGRLAIVLLASAIPSLVLAALPDFDLAQLMAILAQVDQSVVAFEETRHFALLTTPVVRHGTLHYARPDRLEMHVVA